MTHRRDAATAEAVAPTTPVVDRPITVDAIDAEIAALRAELRRGGRRLRLLPVRMARTPDAPADPGRRIDPGIRGHLVDARRAIARGALEDADRAIAHAIERLGG